MRTKLSFITCNAFDEDSDMFGVINLGLSRDVTGLKSGKKIPCLPAY